MQLFRCCCQWSYVVGRKRVYGPIYALGIGQFPDLLATTQRMMTREEWADEYADCAYCFKGGHRHRRAG